MTNLKFAAALFSIIMIISPHCATAQQISGAKFIMNTKDDDKDSDEDINIKIIKMKRLFCIIQDGFIKILHSTTASQMIGTPQRAAICHQLA